MTSSSPSMRASVVEYCATIGADRLLVQGAGGNVSWKDEDTLWIKASGTWLAEADAKDIFVPVDLPHLRAAITHSDFNVQPRVCGESTGRPSIETLLHALMPHRVVIHLHAIEILAHLVRENCQIEFQSLIENSIRWTVVDYYKPGAELAEAVDAMLAKEPDVDVIFLRNHGVVIGGNDVIEVCRILNVLTNNLATSPIYISNDLDKLPIVPAGADQYVSLKDSDVHQLGLNESLFNRLSSNWALYPDHVVFLGPRAYTYKTWGEFWEKNKLTHEQPELVFIEGEGVFAKPIFNEAKLAQLRCYYDVLARQKPVSPIRSLTLEQIAVLLNWDAEQYRLGLAK